jgi:hypothetical protein
MSEIDAYVAGLFDGEGHVGIARRRQPSGAFYYCLHVQFHMTNKEVLEFLHLHFGGIQVHACKRYERRKQGYRWNLFGKNAAALLKRVRPYLIVKAVEADVALEFQSINVRRFKPTGGFRHKTEEETKLQDTYYHRLRSLKAA